MKRTRFTDEQIIGILAEHKAGAKRRPVPQARDVRRHLHQIPAAYARNRPTRRAR